MANFFFSFLNFLLQKTLVTRHTQYILHLILFPHWGTHEAHEKCGPACSWLCVCVCVCAHVYVCECMWSHTYSRDCLVKKAKRHWGCLVFLSLWYNDDNGERLPRFSLAELNQTHGPGTSLLGPVFVLGAEQGWWVQFSLSKIYSFWSSQNEYFGHAWAHPDSDRLSYPLK